MRNRFVLVADTSDAFLDTLREELATTDYALFHAKDGQEAIDYLELLNAEIDLVIIALELPVVSGLDVIWRLVEQKHPKHTRIIATSYVEVPRVKQVVKALGVDEVVRIPRSAQALRKTVRAVLSARFQSKTSDGVARM